MKDLIKKGIFGAVLGALILGGCGRKKSEANDNTEPGDKVTTSQDGAVVMNPADAFYGLSGIAIGDNGTSIQLQWKEHIWADNYKLFQAESLNGPILEAAIATFDKSARTGTVSNLAPGQSYCFNMQAFRNDGNTADYYGQNKIILCAKLPIPNATTTPTDEPLFRGVSYVEQVDSTSIELEWSNYDNASEFNIYMSVGPKGSVPAMVYTTPLAKVSGQTKMYKVLNVGDDLTYAFVVRAINKNTKAEEANTRIRSVETHDNGAPIFSGVHGISLATGGIKVRWNSAQGEVATYRVYYQAGTTIDFTTASYKDVSADATETTITGLTTGQQWSFAVRAFDSHSAVDTNLSVMTTFVP